MESYKSHIAVSNLLLFQSLKKGDLDIAFNLYRDVLLGGIKNCGHDIVMAKPEQLKAPYELAARLEELRDKCTKNKELYPWIHLDMHGDKKKGLSFAEPGLFMSWHEFGSWCRKINHACANNLTVVVGTCSGFYALKAVSIKHRTPYANLIGPTKVIKGQKLRNAMMSFYGEFFKSFDASRAYNKIKDQFQVYIAEIFLINAITGYHTRHCKKSEVDIRTNRILTQSFMSNPAGKAYITGMRKYLKKQIRTSMSLTEIKDYYDRFLMADDTRNNFRYNIEICEKIIGDSRGLDDKSMHYQVHV